MEYGEEIQYGESKGTFTTVGDEEHAKIKLPAMTKLWRELKDGRFILRKQNAWEKTIT